MKNRERDYFDPEPVKAALEEYKKTWQSILSDGQGYPMLQRHGRELEKQIQYLYKRQDRLRKEFQKYSDAFELDKKDVKSEAGMEIYGTAMAHTEEDISRAQYVRGMIQRGNGDIHILDELQKGAEDALTMLNQGEKAIFDENGDIRSKDIKTYYAGSSKDTWARYAVMDAIYEKGLEFAINLGDRRDRAGQLAKIPGELVRAKWKYMLSMADAAYSIHIGENSEERINPNHLTLLAGLFAKLESRERGAHNPHIPESHKYRHNPAIHSLHTLALADKLFHKVLHEVDYDPVLSVNQKKQYAHILKEMRKTVFQAALIHDVGEIDGELTEGIKVADWSKEKRKWAKHFKEPLEHETFMHYLNEQKDKLHHIGKDGKATDKPITEQEWGEIKNSYEAAYNLPEQKNAFLGRFFKTLETIQSQQDILRFQNIEGAVPLIEASPSNKEFSCNYASTQFYDMDQWYGKPGKESLYNLVGKSGDYSKEGDRKVEKRLQERLTVAMEEELTKIMKLNFEKYYGENSPEALRYEATVQRRPPVLTRAS